MESTAKNEKRKNSTHVRPLDHYRWGIRSIRRIRFRAMIHPEHWRVWHISIRLKIKFTTRLSFSCCVWVMMSNIFQMSNARTTERRTWVFVCVWSMAVNVRISSYVCVCVVYECVCSLWLISCWLHWFWLKCEQIIQSEIATPFSSVCGMHYVWSSRKTLNSFLCYITWPPFEFDVDEFDELIFLGWKTSVQFSCFNKK